MRNLVNRSPYSVVREVGIRAYQQHFGLLTSTRSRHHPRHAVFCGAVWGMDNHCFNEYDEAEILRGMAAFRDVPHCLFFVAPDIWGDAQATLLLFQAWLGTIQRHGYPVAFCAQDGIQDIRIPWDSFDVLFIGGSNPFKYSLELREVCAEAKRRGKWIHHGRVNTPQRIRYSHTFLQCDSFDGTHYTRAVQDTLTHLPYQLNRQLGMPL